MTLSEEQIAEREWSDRMYDQAMAIIEPQEPEGPCIGHEKLFYSGTVADQATAVRWCESCPMQFHCLRKALDAHDPWGIWGGMTPRQRAIVQQRRERRKIGAYRIIWPSYHKGFFTEEGEAA